MIEPRTLEANNIDTGTGAVVASSGDLATLVAADGELVYVKSRRMFVRFAAGQALTTSQTVFAGTGGQWNREAIADVSWASQAAWFIDATNGSDDNTGLTSGTALKTWAELQQRIDEAQQCAPLMQTTTVSLLGSLAEYCHLRFAISESAAPNSRFVVKADASAITTTFAGTGGLSAVAAITRGAGGGSRQSITDANTVGADFTTKVGQRIKLTTGANVGAIAFIAKSTAATVALTTGFNSPIDPATGDGITVTQVNPAINDQYVLQTLPSVYGLSLIGTKLSGTLTADRVVWIVSDIQIGPGAAGTSASSSVIGDLELSGPGSLVCSISQSIFKTSNILGRQCALNNCFYQADGGTNVSVSAFQVAGGGALCSGNGGFFFCQRPTSFQASVSRDFLVQGGPFTILGTISVTTNGVGVFDSPVAAVTFTTTALARCIMAGTAVFYGNGNTGVGIDAGGDHVIVCDTLPTVTGTAGDFKIGGQILTWAADAPSFDPSKGIGILLNSITVPSVTSVKRTGIAAAVGATNLFTAAPQPGLYRFSGVIVITTDGAAGDTVSLTFSNVDSRTTETQKVPLTDMAGVVAVVASAVGAANNKQLSFEVMSEVNSGNPTYAIAFPTKTGAPVITFRVKVERIT